MNSTRGESVSGETKLDSRLRGNDTVGTEPDRGARNLLILFGMVLSILAAFYLFLAIQGLRWAPSLFIRNSDSPSSRVQVSYPSYWTEISSGEDFRAEHPLTPVEKGAWLFRTKGCVLCHGVGGEGGIPNPNSARSPIPPVKTIAQRLFLSNPKNAQEIISILEQGVDLSAYPGKVPIPRFVLVKAQYQAVKNLILKGNPSAVQDPKKEEEPFDMPAWKGVLSGADARDIMAYLISLYPWEMEHPPRAE